MIFPQRVCSDQAANCDQEQGQRQEGRRWGFPRSLRSRGSTSLALDPGPFMVGINFNTISGTMVDTVLFLTIVIGFFFYKSRNSLSLQDRQAYLAPSGGSVIAVSEMKEPSSRMPPPAPENLIVSLWRGLQLVYKGSSATNKAALQNRQYYMPQLRS